MARTGKIAHLPQHIRTQLNTRLADGLAAKPILSWLNALPETKAILARSFDARPISEQNLSHWRSTGYQEWLAHQDILAHAKDLAAHRQELQTVAPGQSFTDHLAAAVAFRYGAILAAQGLALDDSAIDQLRALGKTCQAVVKLRRSDQNAARLKIETERWELTRPNLTAENDEKLKRRQRDALAAPIWAAAKAGENLEKFGDGPASRIGVEYLREIETCPDPANFESKVLTPENLEKAERHAAEMKKNPPVKQTDVQAAVEMLREMDKALDKNGELKPKSPRRRPRAARPKCRPAKPRSPHRGSRTKAGLPRRSRQAKAGRPVHHSFSEGGGVHKAHPTPTPPPPTEGILSTPAPATPPVTSPTPTEAPIKVNPT